ncbi:MAG: TolC family protein [Comamonas sp.]|uniref:TolC family protein n=1 Tax=Comamonas sp. TaxID=34028 RepID=UPI00281EEE43|nr:TolC family protein [Comamonas sp.]MDR0213701.1 TolC family protein [Comamonas sp.]
MSKPALLKSWHCLAVAAALCCSAVNAADLASGAETVASPMAAAPVAPVTLQEYLRLVVQNQPALAAERMQTALAKADSRAASAFPNPAAHYSSKRGEKEWGVEQPIPIFGQRGMRMENAKLGEKAAVANADVAVAVTMSDAAHAFNELLVAQQRYKVWQGAQDEMNKAGYIVKGQIEAGTRSRYDGARLNLQQAQMSMQVGKAQAALKDAASRVASIAALPQWQARVDGSLQASDLRHAPAYGPLWETAQTSLPVLRAAQAELDRARQKIKLEQREALPTPTFGVSRIRNSVDGSFNQVGVNVEIPLFDRRQGAIDRAKVEADQAELRRDAAVLAAQSELQRSLQQLQLRRTAVRDYEKEGLAQIAPLHQMAQDAYKLGKGTILELIDALGSITEHRLEHLELVKDMLDAEWEVRLASGDLPQVQP